MRRLRLPAVIIAGTLVLGACGSDDSEADKEKPVVVEEVEGTDLGRITLTQSAAERLDIQVTAVETGRGGLTVPSAAVIIDPEGVYWVYTNPEPLVYIRQELDSAYEDGQHAYFEAGPAVGTAVVVTGVPELYGAEFGIGK